MIKSIEYFEKKCIKKFEELENNFMREPDRLAEYVLGLTDELHKLGLEMIRGIPGGNEHDDQEKPEASSGIG